MTMIGSTWSDDCCSSTNPGMKGSPRREALGAVADKLIHDLNSRSGLRNVWDGIHRDIREEIRDAWIDIIAEARAVP